MLYYIKSSFTIGGGKLKPIKSKFEVADLDELTNGTS